MAPSNIIDLGPIGKVHPFLKASRWSLLLLGIWWGNKRWYINKEKADEEKAYIKKMQPVWDAEKKAAYDKNSREQLLILAVETGTPIPKGF